MEPIIGIIGVGYVGLQNAITISKAGFKVIAYDVDKDRIHDLCDGIDRNFEAKDITNEHLIFTYKKEVLREANYYLISVPTPINEHSVPNIYPLKCAAQLVAEVLKKGDVVVLESTVFPGATRELLIPILEEQTALQSGLDFFVCYSSERIVPGDPSHNSSNVTKVISGQNEKALDKIYQLYLKIFTKLHIAPNLEVAESSKLLENIQRDINIALMNEFAQFAYKMGISIHDVLDAAKTKWNFLSFRPGLVGGHCIPEDPHYLIYQANKIGAHSSFISSARQTNEQFFHFIIEVTVNMLTQQGISLKDAKVVLMGMSFKPNVTDMRHSLSITLYQHLKKIGLEVFACDPVVNQRNNKLDWVELDEVTECKAIIVCQAHDAFLKLSPKLWSEKIAEKGVFIDIPGILVQNQAFRQDILYGSL